MDLSSNRWNEVVGICLMTEESCVGESMRKDRWQRFFFFSQTKTPLTREAPDSPQTDVALCTHDPSMFFLTPSFHHHRNTPTNKQKIILSDCHTHTQQKLPSKTSVAIGTASHTLVFRTGGQGSWEVPLRLNGALCVIIQGYRRSGWKLSSAESQEWKLLLLINSYHQITLDHLWAWSIKSDLDLIISLMWYDEFLFF